MGSKKGQLFILGVIFLVGLIFIVQQALLGYTSLDISEPPERGESYLVENILKTIKMAISETSDCNVFGERMEEVRKIIEMGKISGANSVSLDYVLDCGNWGTPGANVMNVTIITTGQDSESHGFFEFHSPEPVILGIEDHYGVPDSTVGVPIYMENRDYEVSGIEFDLEFEPNILELQDIEGIGRAEGFNVMREPVSPGKYHVVAFKTGTVIPWGSEDTINLIFKVNSYASIGSKSDLLISSLNLGNRLGEEITRKVAKKGKFEVVEEPEITVIYPNGGEKIEKGYSYEIRWDSKGNIQKVDIELYRSGAYETTLFPDTPNDGSEDWTPTNTDVPQDGTDYKIMIKARGAADVYDMSDGSFEIFTPVPVLKVVPDSITFKAQEGESQIADEFFSITNTGTGTMSWITETDDGGTGWLSVYPENGIGDDTVSVSADNTILPEGSYSGTVTITASNPVSSVQNSPLVLDVDLDITQKPVLEVSETLLTFNAEEGGTDPDPLTFDISNSGGGTLNWHATETEDWLDLSPASGTGDGMAYVSVDITGMTEADSPYTGTVSVSDPNAEQSPRTVNIEVYITTNPVISASPSTLTFTATENGPDPDDQTLTISNSGSGSLSWTATESEDIGGDWLSVSPASGGDGGTITVSVDNSGLTPGTYTGTVTITDSDAENSPFDVPVSLTVNPDMSPLIEVTEPTGSDTWTMGDPYEIRWTGRSVSDEVSIGLYRGTQFHDFIVRNTENLGSFTWTLPSTLSDGTNYRVRVMDHETGASGYSEEFEIIGEAVVNVVPDSLSFTATKNGPDPDDQTITIENTGTGTLAWEADESIPWLTVTPSSGSDEGLADVSVDITGLPDGTYSETVTIREQGDPSNSFSLPVGLTVNPEPPEFTLTKPNGGETYTEGDTMEITWEDVNGGDNVRLHLYRTYVYEMEIASSTPNDGSHSWEIPSGIVGGDRYRVRVRGVENGAYDYSDGYFTINLKPALTVDPMSLAYEVVSGDQDPKVQYITVKNTGGGSFDWSAADENDFVFDPASGTLGAGQSEVIASTFYPFTDAGTYSRSCIISAPGAVNDPETVDITISILPPPALEVSPLTMTFSMDEGANPSVQSQSFSISNSGEGTLQWTVQTASSGWLSVDSYSGSGDYTVNALADVQGMEAGTYQGQITVTGTNPNVQGSPKTIDVTLAVNSVYPTIDADPSSLSFSADKDDPNPPSQDITITNTGKGTLEWTATEREDFGGDWLSVSPASGGDGGTITVSVDNSGLTPGTYTGTVTITDSDATNSPVTVDVSHKVNDVDRYITITEPDQPTTWYRFYLYHIGWDEQNSGDNVKIVLYKDSGSTFFREIYSSTRNDGLAGWKIPGNLPEGDDYRVGVGSLDYPVSDISDHDIKIRHPIKVEYPNTPVVWRTGETKEITWSGRMGMYPDNPVRIGLYKGGILEHYFGQTNNDGSKSYEVPNVPEGDDYKIRITDSGDWDIYDESDTYFSIYKRPVLSLSPKSLGFVTDEGTDPGGKNFAISNSGGGSFTWTATDDMDWATLSSTSGSGEHSVLVTIDASGLSPGSYSGTITVDCSGDCVDGPKTLGVSLTVNEVLNPSLTVTVPNGGESWKNGDTRDIEWTSTDIGEDERLKIEMSDGENIRGINLNTENDGIFSWHVCADTQASNYYKIKVSMRDDETVFDESDSTFYIGEPLFGITSPGGGETLSAGQTYDITWDTGIATTYVQIYLYKAGVLYDTIIFNTQDDGSYTWTVPNGLDGNDFSIYIRDYYCTNYVFDESNQFTITSVPAEEPVLYVSSSSLSFSAPAYQGSSETQTFSVQNTGSGTLEWTASDDRSWLTLSKYSGTGDSSIQVDTIYNHGLAPGTYTGTITVTCTGCQGSPKYVSVNFEVLPEDNFEIVDTSGSGKYVSIPLNLRNSVDIDEFDMDIEYDHRVLERLDGITKTSRSSSMNLGITSGTGTGSILTGTVNPNYYIPSGSGKIVDMIFRVNGSADIGDTSPITIKRLYNVGNPDGIPVYPSDFDLYDGVFTLADSGNKLLIPDDIPGSAGGSVTFPVKLDNTMALSQVRGYVYLDPGVVDCNSNGITFERTSRSQPMGFVNSGGNCLSDARGSYIFFALSAGQLYPGSGDILRITVPIMSYPQASGTILDNVGYDFDDYNGQDVSNQFSIFDGSINLEGGGPGPGNPQLTVNPLSLSMACPEGGTEPCTDSFSISNSGDGTLSWTITDDRAWMTVSPASGTESGTPQVDVDTTDLDSGTHTGTITVDSNGGTETVSVEVFVEPDITNPVRLEVGKPSTYRVEVSAMPEIATFLFDTRYNYGGGGLYQYFVPDEGNPTYGRTDDVSQWNLFHMSVNDGSWHYEPDVNGNSLIIENSSTRARILQTTRLTGNFRLERTWTFYPMGPKVFINDKVVISSQEDLRCAIGLYGRSKTYSGFYTDSHSDPGRGWMVYDSADEYSGLYAFPYTDSFCERDDLLNWETGPEGSIIRSRVRETESNQISAGNYYRSYGFYPKVEEYLDGIGGVAKYSSDYRGPNSLLFSTGSRVTDDTGDEDYDGFNEAEGCYVMRASGNEVDFTFRTGELELDPDMVLWFHMNNDPAYGESSTHIHDFSGYGNDGTADTGTSASPGGVYEGYRAFFGNGKVNVNDDSTLRWRNFNDFSIETWVKINGECSGNKVFLGKYNDISIGGRWWVGCNGGDNTGAFHLEDLDLNSEHMNGKSAINDGLWHHVVAVREASPQKMKIYVDGHLDAELGTAFTNDFINYNRLTLGYFDVSPYYYLDGGLDEVAIYRRALSSNEVKSRFSRGIKKYYPSFKILDYSSTEKPRVMLNGEYQWEGRDYIQSRISGTNSLIIQLLKEVNPSETSNFNVRPS